MSSTLQPYGQHYVGPPFEEARVHDAMRIGVVTCRPQTSLRDAARIMVGYQIHALVVGDLGTGERPWGILTDLDIAKAAASGRADAAAGDAAGTDLVTVPVDETLEAASKLMADHGSTHLLAVQPETGQPAGVISALGIASVIAAHG